MRVKQIMTPNPARSTPDRTAREVAILMRDNDCGSIPVLVGIVTQADIAREEGAASDREVGRIIEAISEPRSDLPA